MKRPKSLFKQRSRSGAFKAEKEPTYDPNDRRYIAVHEAGHAVAAAVLGLDLKWVDIKKRRLPDGGRSEGYTQLGPVHLDAVAGKSDEVVASRVAQAMAGTIAESMINSRVSEYDGHKMDIVAARQLVVAAVCKLTERADGNLEATLEEQERNSDRMEAIWKRGVAAASELVEAHQDAILEVADLLLERERLTGDEVAAIVNGQ